MREIAPPQPTPYGAYRASNEAVRASRKSGNSGNFEENSNAFDRPAATAPPHVTVELVCQDETKLHDPFRDSPRLTSPFVAQLIGQMMPEAMPERISPHRGYEAAPVPLAMLLDRKS